MPSNVGYGASVGNNFGGGGIIYVTDLSPAPSTLIPDGDPIEFTLGVQGGLVDLSTIQITISSEIGFDGSVPEFGSHYSAGSSFVYNASANGYDFSFERTGGFPTADLIIVIEASTVDGGSTTQTYSIMATPTPQYPPFPYGAVLASIPLANFSGESQAGYLSGAAGQVFFTTGLDAADPTVVLDVDNVEIRTYTPEHYVQKQTDNSRPFLWGPPFASPPIGAPEFPPLISVDYLPVLNDSDYTFLKTSKFSIHGVMHDTISGDDTIILY